MGVLGRERRSGGVAIEVIGAGLGRTGTSSLKEALETLGFGPCYHMTEVFAHLEHVPVWEAARGECVEWEDALHGYRAAVDWPAPAFYEELMRRYPGAKVILTVRDPERWYESTLNTIYEIQGLSESPAYALSALLVPPMRRVRRATRVIGALAWRGLFGGRFEDREHAIAVFEKYNAEVARRVPAERLLVYEAREGWEPLCAFLGVEVPEGKPFPHANDTEEFRKRIRAVRAISVAVPTVTASLVGLCLFLIGRRLVR